MNILARAAAATAEAIGAFRGAQAAAFRAAYHKAARIDRMNPPPRRSVSPNTPALADWPVIAARVRSMKRDNPVLKGAITSLINHIWHAAPTVEPMAAFPGGNPVRLYNDAMERLWLNWCAGDCDFDGWSSHRESLEAMLWKLTNVLICDGEVFVILRNRAGSPGAMPIQIELVERDRLGDAISVSTVGIRRPGIVYDEQGRPVAYQFRRSLDQLRAEVEAIPAADVLHIMLPDRPQQDVGDIALACVISTLADLNEWNANELQIKATMSRIAGVVTGTMPGTTSEVGPDGSPFRQLSMDVASIWELPEGYEWKDIPFDRPGANFEAFANQCLRFVAVGLGLPYSLVSSDYRAASWSSERSAWMQAYPVLNHWRHIIRDQFLRPLYIRFAQTAIVTDRVRLAPGMDATTATHAAYHMPGFRYIDPEKEVRAEVAAINAGLASPQEIAASHGRDYYAIIDQIREGALYAAESGVKFEGLPSLAATEAGDIYQYHMQFGVLTVNEVRERIGLPAVPWGDERTIMPGTPAPDATAGESATPDPAPQRAPMPSARMLAAHLPPRRPRLYNYNGVQPL
jgi:lambda family phage portal protein